MKYEDRTAEVLYPEVVDLHGLVPAPLATVDRPVSRADAAKRAYLRFQAEIGAVPAPLVRDITTDVPMLVARVLGAVPRIESLLPEMRRAALSPPEAAVARLTDRALAVLYAHERMGDRAPDALRTLLEEARSLREVLLRTAEHHASFGWFDPQAVARIRAGLGHLDRARDLIALAQLFSDAWPAIGARTDVKAAQVERAGELGQMLLAQLGARSTGTGPVDERQRWRDLRNRAYRLLMDDYNLVRKMIAFTRLRERDAHEFAPPLHVRTYSQGKKTPRK